MHKTVIFFELGHLLTNIGLLILIFQIKSKRHIEGISFYTQLLFAISSYAKVFYFPFTVLNEYWLCWAEFIMSLLLTSYLMYLMSTYKRISFNKEKNFYDYRIIIVVSLVLGFFSSYSKGEKFEWGQYALRFSIICEAIGMLPQLRVMKQEKFVTRNLGYYLICLALSRICRIIFWIYQFLDRDNSNTFYTLIIADMFYIVLIVDFVYNFFKHRNSTLIPYS